jgi:hypothetical protein
MSPLVTASDASETGGGICASLDLKPKYLGEVDQFLLSQSLFSPLKVVLISVFSGISSMLLALRLLKVPLVGSVIIEPLVEANRVSKAWFPGAKYYSDVTEITLDEVREWARAFSSCDVVVYCGGPPSQCSAKRGSIGRTF